MRHGAVRAFIVIAALLGGGVAAAALHMPAPGPLDPLSFLLGTWEGVGSGKPGEATGQATFAPGLQGRIMTRTSYADTPATSTAPASRHDDLLIIYAAEDGRLRADYWDNEGHVIRYAVSVPSARSAIFVSDIVTGAPRYRLTYQMGADGALRGTFAVAPPGKPEDFAQYLAWDSRKVPAKGR
jgi:hypothetical protein